MCVLWSECSGSRFVFATCQFLAFEEETKPTWSSVSLIWLLEVLGVGWTETLIFFTAVSHGGMGDSCFPSQEKAAAFSVQIFHLLKKLERVCEIAESLAFVPTPPSAHRPAWVQGRLGLIHSGYQ